MTDSDKLVKYFETKYAPYKVEMCEVMYDRHTTRSRGFGFVTMDVRAVAAAVDDQARDKLCHQLDGKHFEVRPATPVGASPPPAPPGVGIVNRPAGDLDALLTGAPARAPSFTPSAPRPGGYQMPPPNGAMYAPPPNGMYAPPPPQNFGLKDVCRDFQNGRCNRGDSCKYVHAAPGAPPPAATWMPPAAPSAPPPPMNGWRPPDVGPPLGGSPRSSNGFAAASSGNASGWRPPDVGPPLGGGFGGGSPRSQTYAPPPSNGGGPSDAVSAALQAMRAIEGNLKRQRVAPAAPAAPAMPYMPSPAQRCSDWIAAAGVDGAASSLFNESPLAVKLAAMDAGPVTGSNPSACLVARVIRLKKAHRDGGLPNREF